MHCYLITFELDPAITGDTLISAIKSYGTWGHVNGSNWAVVTEGTAASVRDKLAPLVGKNGRLFVIKTGIEAAWYNSNANSDWLKKYLMYG